ncbi:hypothetical protein JTE90_003981 [Oedothorax gibbosus]|uniref:Uncharacterized protein n=1 Tax=Oedothorax gibbosus TaxID=931172 RepID=A0AAV6UCD0_9ARAC|nr:hypothetical protein JTE90_003981 [Oedothorax gibbosus]
MVQCICEICICGQHQCEHTQNHRVPYAKDEHDACKLSEHKDRFRAFCCPSRAQPVLPKTNALNLTGSEGTVKLSTTKRDYVSHPVEKRAQKKAAVYKEPKGKFQQSTTYKSDFKPKIVKVRTAFVIAEPTKDGTMPGTLPGKFASETTYARNYVPKICPPRELPRVQGCTLTKLGQHFSGITETKLCYQPPNCSKREKAVPRKGELKAQSGSFDGQTTHKTDFTAKFVEPPKTIKTTSKWKPTSSDKFHGTTTHAHDYKCPPPVKRNEVNIPKESYQKWQGPFEGISNYKKDFPAHDVSARKLPKWHPSSRSHTKSDLPPLNGQTTYKTDFLSPPEDLQPVVSKHAKDNLTLSKGTMEQITSSMRDYRRFDCPVKTISFKPETRYKKPEGKFADCTTTKCNFTAKVGERVEINKTKVADNIEMPEGPMEDCSTTKKDFQWKCIDCPAKYLKEFGKDALPAEYKFVEKEKGHVYFKKMKKSSLRN